MPGADIEGLIQQAAAKYNLDPDLFRRQLVAESNLNPSIVNPTSGAAGVAQFMPATARGLGIDPLNPTQAVPAAAQYMRQNLNSFGGDYAKALAAYNWGPGNVANKGMDAAPLETRNYIAKILGPGQAIPIPPVPPVPPAAPAPAMQAGPDPAAPDSTGQMLAALAASDQTPSLGDIIARTVKRARGVT